MSVIGKLFERILANRLQKHLKQNFLHNGHARFMKKKYYMEQIIYTLDEIKTQLPHNDVTGVFLDISKAFDRIW